MEIRRSPARTRRALRLCAATLVPAVLSGCTGRGGGELAPDAAFTGSASFGFTFSCEDSSALTGPSGRLRIQLSYTDHGTSPGFEPFTVHGTADDLDPWLESAICIGQEPPPGGNELIFLGRYWPTSSSSDTFASCTADDTTEACRFEVIVRDHDRSLTPSPGDFFSITLSSGTGIVSQFSEAAVLYTRAGAVTKGNITVDY